jgi:hypothetical protein
MPAVFYAARTARMLHVLFPEGMLFSRLHVKMNP